MCSVYVLCSSTLPITDPVVHREVRPVCEDVRLLHKRLFETLVSSEQDARFVSQIQCAHISIPLSNLSRCYLAAYTTVVGKSFLLFIPLTFGKTSIGSRKPIISKFPIKGRGKGPGGMLFVRTSRRCFTSRSTHRNIRRP